MERWIRAISELLEACVHSKSLGENHRKEAREKLRLVQSEVEATLKDKERFQQEIADLERLVFL